MHDNATKAGRDMGVLKDFVETERGHGDSVHHAMSERERARATIKDKTSKRSTTDTSRPNSS